MNMLPITLESLETLADEITAEATAAKAKLARLMRAYARILAAREPNKFTRRATIYADEDGACDNSFPPQQEYKRRTGPLSIRLVGFGMDNRATSGGFYHDVEVFTIDPGLYITRDGELIGAEITGTGRFGQFPAHPGYCGFDCEIEYGAIDPDDLDLDRLAGAETTLRNLAFPLIAARTS